MRLNTLSLRARSRLLCGFLTLLLLGSSLGTALATQEASSEAGLESGIAADIPTLSDLPDPGPGDNLDDDDADPIDVDYITVLELFLTAIRTLR